MPQYNDDPESLKKATTKDDREVFYDPDDPKGAWIATDAAVSLVDAL